MRIEARGARLSGLPPPQPPTTDRPPSLDQKTHQNSDTHRKRKEAEEALFAIGTGREEDSKQPQGYQEDCRDPRTDLDAFASLAHTDLEPKPLGVGEPRIHRPSDIFRCD